MVALKSTNFSHAMEKTNVCLGLTEDMTNWCNYIFLFELLYILILPVFCSKVNYASIKFINSTSGYDRLLYPVMITT